MTAREKLNQIIESNRKELSLIKKTAIYSTISLFLIVGLTNLDALSRNPFFSLFRLGILLACAIPFIIIFRAKRAMNKLLCPKCGNKLDYLLLSKDYNPNAVYTAFPANIEKCPFCSLNLDGEIEGI